MAPTHTVRAFDEDLKFLTARVAAMGGIAERMIENGTAALVHNDQPLAQMVIQEDGKLDAAEREIADRSMAVIARRQPLADDLREIVGTIRISSDLERVGDLAKNIAKRAIAVSAARQPVKLFRGLQSLAELASTQLKDVLDVYASREVNRLASVRDRDYEIDAVYTSLFRELLTYMMEDPRNITPCTHLLFCAKNIERMGDHATNIAETIYYIETAEQLPAERPKRDRSHRVTVDAESEAEE